MRETGLSLSHIDKGWPLGAQRNLDVEEELVTSSSL